MVTVDEFADNVMRIVWLLLSVMMCKPSDMKVQLMQYQEILVVLRHFYQPWAAS